MSQVKHSITVYQKITSIMLIKLKKYKMIKNQFAKNN